MLKRIDNSFRNYANEYVYKIVMMSTILINLTIRDFFNNQNQGFIGPPRALHTIFNTPILLRS